MLNNILKLLPTLWFIKLCYKQCQIYNISMRFYKENTRESFDINNSLETLFNAIMYFYERKDNGYCFNLTFNGKELEVIHDYFNKLKFLIDNMGLSKYIHLGYKLDHDIFINECEELTNLLEKDYDYIKLKQFILSYVILKHTIFHKYEYILSFNIQNSEILLCENIMNITNVLSFYKDINAVATKYDFKVSFIEKNTAPEKTTLSIIFSYKDFLAIEGLLQLEGF